MAYSLSAALLPERDRGSVTVSQEPVNFDAVLTPSTLQYSISKASKASRAAALGA